MKVAGLRGDRVLVHIARYEDMREDMATAIAGILEFLEVLTIDEERVEAAVELTRFDRMRDLEDRSGFPEKSEHQERFFGSGRTSGWEDELPGDLARKIVNHHGAVMERIGYLQVPAATPTLRAPAAYYGPTAFSANPFG